MRHISLCIVLAVLTSGTLRAQEPLALDTLHVSVLSRLPRSAAAIDRSVQIFDAAQLARAPVQNITEALTWATGVDVLTRSPASADVGIRGASAEQVLVLVNGVRVSDRQTAHLSLDIAVPLDQVERIEVLRGAATALYGSDAVGGVINIVTRTPARARASARVRGGSFATAGGAVDLATGGSAFAAALGGELDTSDGFRHGTDYRTRTARAEVRVPLGSRLLALEGGYTARDFGARAFYTAPASPFDEFEKTRATTASARLPLYLGTRVVLEPQLSVRKHDDDFVLRRRDPAFYRNVHHTWQRGGEITGRVASPTLPLAFGAEWYNDALRSTALGDRDESRAAVFGEVNVGSARRAQARLGLRQDWSTRYGSFLAPSASGSVALSRAVRVRASAGRSFRAPTWTDRYYRDPANIGSPDLEPERAYEVEGGIDVGRDAAHVSVAAFLRHAEDLIDWVRPAGTPATTPWVTTNVTQATFRGVELDAGVRDPIGSQWSLSVAALDFDAAREGLLSKYALRPLTRSAQLRVERPLRWLTATARAVYAKRADADAYARIDARLATRGRRWTAYLDAINATDTSYLDVSGLNASGRELRAGVGVQF